MHVTQSLLSKGFLRFDAPIPLANVHRLMDRVPAFGVLVSVTELLTLRPPPENHFVDQPLWSQRIEHKGRFSA